jgi:LuxR family transcriptional regulator, maltose regulon positive regulatory protein
MDLVAALADPSRSLTLLSAPAGSGKTTLLAEWHADGREERPFAWLSLDEEDNDPVRFWTCIIEALRAVRPEIGDRAEAALRAPGTSLNVDVLPLLINELVELPDPMVLVIDEYHLVSDGLIHESIGFLVDRLPATLHLAMATRSDPALPLPRLRSRDQLTEIRASDLRFSEEEAAAMLSDFGLRLDTEQVSLLHRRTEGWAAGLQLAALSLRNRSSPDEFIASFAGDDRQIVDYLWSEVLSDQDPRLLQFMLRTSILDRLSTSLCAAVTGDEDAAEHLTALELGNIFTVPLDSSREWYRYHHLFRQLLRSRLEREPDQLVPELHRRAATWYEENHLIPDAIRHANAAADTAMAAELTAAHWSESFNSGFLVTVAGWLDALPEATVAGDSRLWLARVWTAMDQGRLDETDRWLKRGEEVAEAEALAATRDKWLRALRAIHSFKSGDVGAGRVAVRTLDVSPDDEDPFWSTVACFALGITAYWSGEARGAERVFEQARRLAEANGNALGTIYALGYLGTISIERGAEREAEHLLRRAADTVGGEPQLDEHFTAMVAHLARGRLLAGQGSLASAEGELTRALELARRGAGNLELAAALLASGELRHTEGDAEIARELVAEASRLVERCADPGIGREQLARVQRTLSAGAADSRSDVAGAELSERELGVLRLLPSGLSLRQIGAELYVSLNTVKTHVRHIYLKLDAGSRNEAVARARELGLL